jgi:hypothetical protein
MTSLGTANAAEKLQGLIDCTLAPGFPGWWRLAALPFSRSRCPTYRGLVGACRNRGEDTGFPTKLRR